MENKIKQVEGKVLDFFYQSMPYFGKEVSLPSSRHFGIDEIVGEEEDKARRYRIQYGFPQSGCVSIEFEYANQNCSIDKIKVYAPPADKSMVIADYQSESQFAGIGMSVNFGMDMGTQEHKSGSEIAANPNALSMLDIAIDDLSKAEILGECRTATPVGSKYIPCCVSRANPTEKGNSK